MTAKPKDWPYLAGLLCQDVHGIDRGAEPCSSCIAAQGAAHKAAVDALHVEGRAAWAALPVANCG